jgi:hypothetical protein
VSHTWKEQLTQCHTVTEIKTLYRTLAKQFHPDLGGSNEIMREINDLYHRLLKKLDGSVNKGTDGKTHTYWYNETTEQEIIDKIAELFAANLSDNVEIWLIGTWIWILNTVKELDRDKLKDLSCRWHSKRKCWYWQNAGYRSFYSATSLDSLARTYGCKQFTDDDRKKTPQYTIA